jgi:hypothetical protein
MGQVVEHRLQGLALGGGAEKRSRITARRGIGEGGWLVACVELRVPSTDCTASENANRGTIINLLKIISN